MRDRPSKIIRILKIFFLLIFSLKKIYPKDSANKIPIALLKTSKIGTRFICKASNWTIVAKKLIIIKDKTRKNCFLFLYITKLLFKGNLINRNKNTMPTIKDFFYLKQELHSKL